MKTGKLYLFTLVPLMAVLMIGALSGSAAGAAVLIGDELTNDPEDPRTSDVMEVTADITLIDAEIVEDGVVLMWSLCTEEGCGLPTTVIMTDNADDTWSASIGPFDETDASGELYVDIMFHVEVTYTPSGGGDEAVEEGEQKIIYFNLSIPADDDDGDDSPFGAEVLFIGVIIAGAVAFYSRRK